MYAVAQINTDAGSFLAAGKLLANGRMQCLKAAHLTVQPAHIFLKFGTLAKLKLERNSTDDFAQFRAMVN